MGLVAQEQADTFSLGAFLRDKAASLIVGAVCALGVFWMCLVLGVGTDAAVAVSVFVALCLLLALGIEYARRARFWRATEALAAAAQSAAELSELLPDPSFLEGRLAADLANDISTRAGSELARAQTDADGYREYVELWIHEAKTPIAAAKLILERMGGEEADVLAREVERMDAQVDQALYYARSTALQKDYTIRRMDVAAAAREACKRQARFLIEKQAIPHVDIPDGTEVLSDEPWIVFILGQVAANAAQYGAHAITFTARVEAPDTPHGRTIVEVKDDGAGISEADLPRVFDRGFTGSNGRRSGSATGMGLYLVSLMCSRLGLGLSIASEEGVGTRIILAFPHDRDRLT